MARKVFISILGTGYYEPTSYFFNNDQKLCFTTRFIQEAAIKYFCSDWSEEDKICIFLTDKSRKTNWKSPAHESISYKESYEGLRDIILSGLTKAEVIDDERICIPNGNSEAEVWEIFQKIYNIIENDDEVYFDITHAFRSLPMLVIVLINYTKFLKNIRLKSITYGNHQAEENGYSPVLDLTVFSEIQDWTNAVNEFVKSGKSTQLNEIIYSKSLVSKGAEKQFLQKFSKSLKELTIQISTVRGKEIYSGETIKKLTNDINALQKKNTISILNPIIYKLKNKISDFHPDYNKENGAIAIKWCIEHGLLQQAYTLSQEHIISLLCDYFKLSYTKKEDRELISNSIGFMNKLLQNPEEAPNETLSKRGEKFLEIKNSEIVNEIMHDFNELSKLRNSINHGGMIGTISANELEKSFDKHYNIIIDIINNYE